MASKRVLIDHEVHLVIVSCHTHRKDNVPKIGHRQCSEGALGGLEAEGIVLEGGEHYLEVVMPSPSC